MPALIILLVSTARFHEKEYDSSETEEYHDCNDVHGRCCILNHDMNDCQENANNKKDSNPEAHEWKRFFARPGAIPGPIKNQSASERNHGGCQEKPDNNIKESQHLI